MSNQIPIHDIDSGNPLIEACGKILSPKEWSDKLFIKPQLPLNLSDIPHHVRLHNCYQALDLYIPSVEALRIADSISILLREGYRKRRPGSSDFFKVLYSSPDTVKPIAAMIVGISGMGKSIGIENTLNTIEQVVKHQKFPGYSSSFNQLVWIKIDAPSTGLLKDLAINLMEATDQALGTDYFAKSIFSKSKNGTQLFDEWLGIARKHAIGLIVIDEIQNFFKQATLKERISSSKESGRLELRIVEDQTLKMLLTASNTWRIPFLFSGTPDGMAAFNTRFSTGQRMLTGGFHEMANPKNEDDRFFSEIMLPELLKYQWVKNRLNFDPEVATLMFRLTAGIPRIYTRLWVATQRHVLERKKDVITLRDLQTTMETKLRPLIPAVQALLSDDPLRLAKYEDLYPHELSY